MKRLLLSTALSLALTGTAAFAQQAQPTLPESSTPSAAGHHHGRHKPNPQQQAEFISKKLNLSADQTAKLTPIFADSDQKRQALFQDQSITVGQMREQMKAINQNTQQQLATVLSPDQLQQLKAMRHDRRGGWGQHGPNGAPNQSPQQNPTGV